VVLVDVEVADVYATSTMKLVDVPNVEVESLYAVSVRTADVVFVAERVLVLVTKPVVRSPLV
jgi:hypothetical protein